MSFFIFDLDGTLADGSHREHLIKGPEKDWDAYFDLCDLDEPIRPIITLLTELYSRGNMIHIWSGRSERVHCKSYEWLERNGINPELLVRMRREKDFTPDDELKREWLRTRRKYKLRDPLLTFDDRDRVVAMWRAEGIQCCQVRPGDF